MMTQFGYKARFIFIFAHIFLQHVVVAFFFLISILGKCPRLIASAHTRHAITLHLPPRRLRLLKQPKTYFNSVQHACDFVVAAALAAAGTPEPAEVVASPYRCAADLLLILLLLAATTATGLATNIVAQKSSVYCCNS